jgi:hypothetical protein
VCACVCELWRRGRAKGISVQLVSYPDLVVTEQRFGVKRVLVRHTKKEIISSCLYIRPLL